MLPRMHEWLNARARAPAAAPVLAPPFEGPPAACASRARAQSARADRPNECCAGQLERMGCGDR
jgi:hypothetical protein